MYQNEDRKIDDSITKFGVIKFNGLMLVNHPKSKF